MTPTNAEDWVKQFDAAIAKGRGTNSETGPDRETAIAELKGLLRGTRGEAEYFLDRKR